MAEKDQKDMARKLTAKEAVQELRMRLERQQEAAEGINSEIRKTVRELAKAEASASVPSEVVMNTCRMMGPMDDVFFNKMGEDGGALEEVIAAVLGVPVVVREVVPQYTIAGIGNRGVRLDALASVIPEVAVRVELGDGCPFGKRGALVDIEVQKADNDDHEFRVYYNGASIIVNNTPKGTKKFADITRAVVIFISEFDMFGEGEMYYEVHKTVKKSGSPRRSPVTEIYVNTVNEDRSSGRMQDIADLMKVFKEPDRYDFEKFPRFSRRKRELRETQKGVMEMSNEIQQILDAEIARGIEEGIKEGIKQEREDARKEGRKEGKAEGEKDATRLINFLWSSGRGEEAQKAAEDIDLRNRLLAEYRSGRMAVK